MPPDPDEPTYSRLGNYRTTVFMVLSVLLFLSTVGGVFYVYVLDRERYFNERYFRLLTSQANNMAQRIDNYLEILESAARVSIKVKNIDFHEPDGKGKIVFPFFEPRFLEVLEGSGQSQIHWRKLSTHFNIGCLESHPEGDPAFFGAFLCQVPDFSNVNVEFAFISEFADKKDKNNHTGRKNNETKHADKKSKETNPSNKKTRATGRKTTPTNSTSVSCQNDNEYSQWLNFVQRTLVLTYEAKLKKKSRTNVFEIVMKAPGLFPDRVTEGNCNLGWWNVRAEVAAQNLFNPTPADQAFDSLLLADRAGSVILQSNPSGFHFSRTDLLFPPEKEKPEIATDSSKYILTLPSQPSTRDLFQKVPSRQEVLVGGSTMYVFAQPMTLPISRDQEKEYIIIGLVAKDRFRKDTWQLSPSVLLILLSLVLLALLSLPLVKLVTLGNGDHLSLTDIGLLTSAGLIGTGLLTLAIVDASAFRNTKDRVDPELKGLTQSINGRFSSELKAALHQLEKFDEKIELILEENEAALRKNKKALNLEKQDPQPKSTTVKNTFLSQPPCLQKDSPADLIVRIDVLKNDQLFKGNDYYKYFDSVFWIDCSGRIHVFFDRRDITQFSPPFVANLSERLYVKNILERRVWRMQDSAHAFWVEPLYSWLDGQNRAVLSIRSQGEFAGDEREQGVAALETRFLSIFEPIIQPGLGFAIVDNADGRVLFHSNGERNLRENLFEETHYNRTLKALVTSRAKDCFDGTYGGNSHRFCVEPIEDLPWTLVVFRNMEPLRTANLQAVSVASALFAIYSLIVVLALIACLAIHRLYGPGLPKWIWPTPYNHGQYLALTVAHSFLLAVGILSLWFLPSQRAFVMNMIALPMAGIIVTYKFLSRQNKPTWLDQYASILKFPQSYVLMIGTLLTLCSVLPAATCLTLSYEEEFTLRLKSDALELARNLAKRADRIRDHYQPADKFHDLLDKRLYGSPQANFSRVSEECKPLHLRNLYDVHLVTWREPNIGRCGEGKTPPLNAMDEDWFSSAHRFLRVPYNDEFTKTHGLFEELQTSEDIRWIPPNDRENWTVSYRAVHDLGVSINNDGHLERWEVSLSSPRSVGHSSVILVIMALGLVIIALLRSRMGPGLTESIPTALGWRLIIAIVGFCGWLLWSPRPGVILELISEIVALLAFILLIHALLEFAARRILLLGFKAPNVSEHPIAVSVASRNLFEVYWDNFTTHQKLALFHLAQTGLLPSTNPGLHALLENGWVVHTSGLHLIDQNFHRFVLSQEEEIARLERQLSGSTWGRLAWPLGIGLLIVLASLLYTQQDLLTGIVAFAGALSALFPVISKMLDLFKSGKPQG
jgi:hypothetical protein